MPIVQVSRRFVGPHASVAPHIVAVYAAGIYLISITSAAKEPLKLDHYLPTTEMDKLGMPVQIKCGWTMQVPKTMHAMLLEMPKQPLRLKEVPVPQPKPNQILIRV